MKTNKPTFEQRIKLFQKNRNRELLYCNLRGIEREALRVTHSGEISQKPHPHSLGSALTHPLITTDYSEALLEFITEPFPKIDSVLEQLNSTHQFTASNLPKDELIWPSSMPGLLGEDQHIPIANYGPSNAGMMKTIYRRGLGHRYGRKMQTIAGIHFNFSVPDALWSQMRTNDQSLLTLQDYRTQGYMGLVRNFRRRFWLLLYLMGASPVADKSFVQGRDHHLDKLNKQDVYLPKATSLRMGDLGYQSSAQDDLYICYNSVESYIHSLQQALLQDHNPYSLFASTGDAEQLQQLSSAVLQIENEFYSTIRPKQTTRRGETQLKALKERGIEYIEVRCVDINPFEPLGISREQIIFLELFLLGCLFDDSPETNQDEYQQVLNNQKQVVTRGREPGLSLTRNGTDIPLQNWASEITEQLQPIAKIMDKLGGCLEYSDTLKKMCAMLEDVSLCPSAQILTAMDKSGQGFVDWSLSQAKKHHSDHYQANSRSIEEQFAKIALQSVAEQHKIEAQQTQSLSDYIQAYFDQYQQL